MITDWLAWIVSGTLIAVWLWVMLTTDWYSEWKDLEEQWAEEDRLATKE